ncbi:MAG: serine/threonine-protein kinase [Planctomycetia bacterium]|nr:serine/threonine-protein kinase [Planctomycetia bacterium]
MKTTFIPRENEVFEIVEKLISTGSNPSKAELDELYPDLAEEIWQCLEGFRLFNAAFLPPSETLDEGENGENSTDEEYLGEEYPSTPSRTSTVFWNSLREPRSEGEENNVLELGADDPKLARSGSSAGFSPAHSNRKDSAENKSHDADSSAFSRSSTPREENEPIGDFQIIRELGRGGMGVVYEARQRSLARLVALKVLPFASTFDERQLQRFHNEAAAAAQLEHPSIVPIYAVGSERGIHYYAMKLIHGQHLGEVISLLREEHGVDDAQDEEEESAPNRASALLRPRRPVLRRGENEESVVGTQVSRLYEENRRSFYHSIAGFMLQAAEALDYAHQCGVIHRDIKPGNLMVDSAQRLWITDFGLARVSSSVHLTQTGDVFGTPRYMSPEQAQGQTRMADHRADIYSLGATFYELLTLHPIFPEKNQVQLLRRITQDEPLPPRAYDTSLPHDLETIILKCISKSPVDRYETAGELAQDLHRFLEDRPILAKRPGIGDIVFRWLRRHPWVLAAAFLALGVTCAAMGLNHYMISIEKEKTQLALSEAQARFQKAREAADSLIRIAEEGLEENDAPATRKMRQKLLDTALILYQDFLTMDALDAETENQLAGIRDYIECFMKTIAEMEGMPPIFLLLNPDVQDDLRLTSAQKEKIEKHDALFRKKGEEVFRNARNMTPEERLCCMAESVRATEDFILNLLSLEQRKRLEQLELQLRPDSICDEAIVERLALTEEQQLQIQMLFRMPDLDEEVRGRPRSPDVRISNVPHPARMVLGRGEPPREFSRERKNFHRQKAIKKILTPEQLELWEEMCGPALECRKYLPPLDKKPYHPKKRPPFDPRGHEADG